jgi:hypothetical protein
VIACPRTKNKIRAPLEGTVSPADDVMFLPFTGSGHRLVLLHVPHMPCVSDCFALKNRKWTWMDSSEGRQLHRHSPVDSGHGTFELVGGK